jgi:hypothetical protein
MKASAAKDAAIELAKQYYKDRETPLYLARVGQHLRGKGLWPIENETRTLKQWLETLAPDIEVIQNPEKPAVVAIATPEAAGRVRKMISDSGNAALLSELPRPVVLAFCIEAVPGKPVYVRITPPYRFEVEEPSASGWLPVEPEFRLPGLRLFNPESMLAEDVERLTANIRLWAAKHDINLINLRRVSAPVPRPTTENASTSEEGSNALERFLAAQDPEIMSRIVIPGDIAFLLSRER